MSCGEAERAKKEDEPLIKAARDCNARNYQVELLTEAIKCNTIVCLKTGAGKTLIAIMLIKEMQHQIEGDFSAGAKRTFFLVPKVPLVTQQAAAIRHHTSLNVGAYYGAMGNVIIDTWKLDQWQAELCKHNILVMTAQILVNMLQHGFISLCQINLIIFDECHMATGNSPYCVILDRFKDFSIQPKVLGLTASIINGKCKPTQVETIMRKLENVMLSRIVTASNLANVQQHATKPKEVAVVCTAVTDPETQRVREVILQRVGDALEVMKPIMRVVEEKKAQGKFGNEWDNKNGGSGGRPTFAALIQQLHDWSNEDDFQLSEGGEFSGSPSTMLKHLVTVVFTLGLYCAKILVDNFVRDVPNLRQNAHERFDDNEVLLYDAVGGVLTDIQSSLDAYCQRMGRRRAMLEQISPRLVRLMELLVAVANRCDVELEKDDSVVPNPGNQDAGSGNVFRAIVFVEQRVVAWILKEYLSEIKSMQHSDYDQLRPCYMVGHGMSAAFMSQSNMSHARQTEALDDFRSGKCNVMVATKVVEEGLDIPKCNLVVRYDKPKEFCSYVQSMGRARAERALYVLLVDQSEQDQLMEEVTMYKMIESVLNLKSHNRVLPPDHEVELHRTNFHKLPPYYPTTRDGACLSIKNAIELLYWYCCRLPSDAFSTARPSFKYTEDEKKRVSCTLRLPLSSMHHQLIEGDLMEDRKLAKAAAAYRACIFLHQNHELNDHLIPSIDYLNTFMLELGVVPNEEADPAGAVVSAAGPGSRKRRRIYPRAFASELRDTLPQLNQPAYLHAITFEVDGVVGTGESCCYGLLSSKLLPIMAPFNVYEKRRLIVRLRRVGPPQVMLSADRLAQLEAFHRTMFAEILRIASGIMEYVGDLADSSFLLVPLDERVYNPDLLGGVDSIGIDWIAVTRFARYVAEADCDLKEQSRKIPRLEQSRCYDDFVEGAMVTALHRPVVERGVGGGRFMVLAVHANMSPRSPFPSNTYSSYGDYFMQKYGADITDWDQPLIYVDFAPTATNLLLPSLPQPDTLNKSRRHQYLIPELCALLPLDAEMYRQALAVPSALHRFNGMLVARELMARVLKEADLMDLDPLAEPMPPLEGSVAECPVTDRVMFGGGEFHRPHAAHLSSLFFQSLTALSAGNWDSLERLEVIGDSYLKFVTSAHLFCRFPNLNEGALTLLRTGLVKNHNLFYHGHAHHLPPLLNVMPFSPRTMWLPPGYCVPEQLNAALLDAGIPYHLWPHAAEEDVKVCGTSQKAWLECLEARWSHADPTYRDNARTSVPDCSSPSRSATATVYDDKEDQPNFIYNQYKEHLIPDKTVADSVEALIGAVLVTGGQSAAVKMLVWLGLKIGPDEAKNGRGRERKSSLVVTGFWPAPATALLSDPPNEERLRELYAPLAKLECKLGYTFRDKSFLRQAIVHPSYVRHPVTDNYQRLEFLGDAVLDFLVTMHLYQKFPNLSPGDLTDLRSSLVDNVTFGYLSVKSEFNKYLNFCSQELFQAIDKYLANSSKLSHPKDTIYMVKEEETVEMDEIEVPKVLGDLFESIAGAVYLDSGLNLEVVWNVFYPMMMETIDRYTRELPINPIRVVMEMFTTAAFSLPIKGERVYSVKVLINGKTYTGHGKTKKIAKHAAAKCALRALHILSWRSVK